MAKGSPRSFSFSRGKSGTPARTSKTPEGADANSSSPGPTPPKAPQLGKASPRASSMKRLFGGGRTKTSAADETRKSATMMALPVGLPPVEEVVDGAQTVAETNVVTLQSADVSPVPSEAGDETETTELATVVEDAGMAQEEAETLKELRQRHEMAHMTEEELLELHESSIAAREERRVAEEERMAQEAAEKERAAREAERQAKLDAMSEAELLEMQIQAKLTADLSTCQSALSKALAELKSVEDEISTCKDTKRLHAASEQAKIQKIDAILQAYDSMVRTVSVYNVRCGLLKSEAAALVTKEGQLRLDTHGISSRVREELVEAQERLHKQTLDLNNMRAELKKMLSDTNHSENKLEEDLVAFSSDVAAKKLKYELSQQQLQLLCTEQAARMEVTVDVKRVEAKKQRVDATSVQVDEIKALMGEDEKKIAGLKVKESELNQANKIAEAQEETQLRVFDADKDTLRSLTALQDAFLDDELAKVEAQGPALHETKKEVLEKTKSMVNERRGAGEKRLQDIETRQQQYLMAVDEERRKRESAMRQTRAERKAIELSHQERQLYLNEKVSQLEVEQKQLFEANCELSDHKDCILMLQSEIELAQQATSECKNQFVAAESLKADCASNLDSVRMKNKIRVAELRVRIDSELRVQMEQQAYITSLQNRVAIETESIAEQSSTQVDLDEDEGDLPLGKQGLELTCQNEKATYSWLEELQKLRDGTEDELSSTKASLESSGKRDTNEIERLEELHMTLSHEVAKLTDYHAALSCKLESSSPQKVVDSSPETPAKQSPRSVIKTPSAEDLSTPYAATHKFLHTSDRLSNPASPSAFQPVMSDIGLDEENDPMFNPDLKYDPSVTASSRSGVRSRVGSFLPGTRLFDYEEAGSSLTRV